MCCIEQRHSNVHMAVNWKKIFFVTQVIVSFHICEVPVLREFSLWEKKNFMVLGLIYFNSICYTCICFWRFSSTLKVCKIVCCILSIIIFKNIKTSKNSYFQRTNLIPNFCIFRLCKNWFLNVELFFTLITVSGYFL